jgi:hypothetical protein
MQPYRSPWDGRYSSASFPPVSVGVSDTIPLDLERTFDLIGGDIFHGSLDLRQLFSARLMVGQGDYLARSRDSILCGSGGHPEGGVTGAPGHNAAREILRDFRHGRVALGTIPRVSYSAIRCLATTDWVIPMMRVLAASYIDNPSSAQRSASLRCRPETR